MPCDNWVVVFIVVVDVSEDINYLETKIERQRDREREKREKKINYTRCKHLKEKKFFSKKFLIKYIAKGNIILN